MSNRTMYIITFSVYLVFVIAFLAVYFLLKDDQDAQIMGMYILSSGLMGITVILGLIFLREKDKQYIHERVETMLSEDDGWDRKE